MEISYGEICMSTSVSRGNKHSYVHKTSLGFSVSNSENMHKVQSKRSRKDETIAIGGLEVEIRLSYLSINALFNKDITRFCFPVHLFFKDVSIKFPFGKNSTISVCRAATVQPEVW